MDTVTVSRETAAPPPVVHAAALLWMAAVAFGAFEAVLMITRLLLEGTATLVELLPQAGFRLAVLAGAIFLALRLRRGHNWARWTLAATLGVFGTLSLVMEPIQWLLDGGSVTGAMAGLDAWGWAFALSRTLHVLAVLGAVVLMFQPRANAYYASA
ncbi:hypothetical protein [Nonomuraea sp. NPDC050783]|uniref:hypothetical protein n=1 Tax=Nonomuraea sp. NPDC050783 TaxID=3154634 RepID=UPI003466E426